MTISRLLVMYFLLTSNAFAYLDPGTGSILLQVLVAFLATITFYFRQLLTLFKKFFIKIKKIFLKK